jgi:hypothetical protein
MTGKIIFNNERSGFPSGRKIERYSVSEVKNLLKSIRLNQAAIYNNEQGKNMTTLGDIHAQTKGQLEWLKVSCTKCGKILDKVCI